MSIFVLADVHGRWQCIGDFLHRRRKENLTKEDTLIILGDSGLNYFLNERDDVLKSLMERSAITYFIIRGNHEERPEICVANNPNDWHIESYFGNDVYVENKYPSIKYAMDVPTIYKIPTDVNEKGYFSTFVLPGAYSVDKKHRLTMGWSWFKSEQPTEDEKTLGLQLTHHLNMEGGCDLVLSHTCPCAFQPRDLFLSFVDQSKVDNSTERWLGQIEFSLNYDAWMWGHYHAFRDYPRNDGKRHLMLFNNKAVDLNDFMTKDCAKGI